MYWLPLLFSFTESINQRSSLSYSVLSKYFFFFLSFFFFLYTHSSKQINRVQFVSEFQRQCVHAHSNDVCAMMMIACRVTGLRLCNRQRVNHIWYHHCWRSLRRCTAHRLQYATRIVTSMDRGSWLRSDCRRIISWFELLVIRVIGSCPIYLVLRFSFLLRCSLFETFDEYFSTIFLCIRRIRKSIHMWYIYFWEFFNLILIDTMKV